MTAAAGQRMCQIEDRGVSSGFKVPGAQICFIRILIKEGFQIGCIPNNLNQQPIYLKNFNDRIGRNR